MLRIYNNYLTGSSLYSQSDTVFLRYTKPTTLPLQPAVEPWVPLHVRCSPPVCAAQSCVVLHCCGPAPAAGSETDTSPLAPQLEFAAQSAPIAPWATTLLVWMGRKHKKPACRSSRSSKWFTLNVYFWFFWKLVEATATNYMITLIVLCVLSASVKKNDSLGNWRNLTLYIIV